MSPLEELRCAVSELEKWAGECLVWAEALKDEGGHTMEMLVYMEVTLLLTAVMTLVWRLADMTEAPKTTPQYVGLSQTELRVIERAVRRNAIKARRMRR